MSLFERSELYIPEIGLSRSVGMEENLTLRKTLVSVKRLKTVVGTINEGRLQGCLFVQKTQFSVVPHFGLTNF